MEVTQERTLAVDEHGDPEAIVRQLQADAWRLPKEAIRAAQPLPAQRIDEPPFSAPAVRESPRVGRNDPCPCGSGKKFKKCCLRQT
jgi:uncharacterized protein YecA (UPF0149 family)